MYNYDSQELPTESAEAIHFELSSELINQVRLGAREIFQTGERNIERSIKLDDTTTVKIIRFRGTNTGDDNFQINLLKNGEKISDFYCAIDQDGNQWKLNHRLVSEKFRHQGIGNKMLKLIEECCQEYCNTPAGTKQELVIDASQLGVTTFALQNGYATTGQEDHKNLKLLLSGANKIFILATAKGYASDGGDRPGFVYRKQLVKKWMAEFNAYSGSEQPLIPANVDEDINKILHKIFYGDPSVYEANAFKIKFSKIFSPT